MKSVSAQLHSDIISNVTTLATCMEIKRKDGQTLRMTTNDSDLDVNGLVYKFDMPFVIAPIAGTSQLSVDNTQITLFCDEVNLFLEDFKSGLFEYASVTIFQVNFADTTRGIITMRTGWFGQIDFSENHLVQITVTGLSKVLDMEIGRIYQPSCDADLGDKRCKVAIQLEQARSELNPTHLGEWVYNYDPALMNAFTVVNSGFEANAGVVGPTSPITGWTRTPGAKLQVLASSAGLSASFSVLAGTYFLAGSTLAAATPTESGVYQDIDLAAQIGGTTDIDAGKLSIFFSAAMLSTTALRNVDKLRVELMNADGVIVDAADTRYIELDDLESWREKFIVMPLLPTVRTARIYLYMLTGATGTAAANAFDRVRMYWWDHTAGSPYSGVVQKAVRTADFAANATYYMYNGSFEGTNVANADNPTLRGVWQTSPGDWWSIGTTAFSGALTAQDGLRFLIGGDDGGSVSNLYATHQIHPLTAPLSIQGWGIDPGRILLAKVVAQIKFLVGYGDTTSRATVLVDWMDTLSTTVGSQEVILNNVTGTVGWHSITAGPLAVHPSAKYVRVTLKARSPTGSGNAKVAYDNIRFVIYDAERPTKTDPATAYGSASTVFSTTPGDYTFDGNVIYKALSAFTDYDVVATVTDVRREFEGTAIAGVVADFQGGLIRWVSGDNAGLKNVIRKWTSNTKKVKLYFRTPHPIQVGDRFFYAKACQRRFIEDCLLRYENTLNFRGFPYVPGALATQNQQTGSVAPPAPVSYSALPGAGSSAGGTGVVIVGNSNMQYVTAVKFGGVPGTSLTHVDNNTLHVISPAHAVGTVNVDVFGSPPGGSFSLTVGTFAYS